VTPGVRRGVFLAGMAAVLAFFLWGLVGLPGFGHYPGPYGDVLNAIGIRQTHATDIVSAVNFDYRAMDTLGEEFILFAAATGMGVVLRHLREERERSAVDEARDRTDPGTSEAVRVAAITFTGPTVVVGWYIVSHGQVSPGGGFQGGVILATAFAMIYLAGEFLALKRISPVPLADAVEAVGAASFAIIGISALGVGAAFLANVLPLGHMPGEVDSAGTIALISFFVGIEVTAAFVVVASEFLEQTLIVRRH